MLKFGQAVFAVACFWGLSDVNKCLSDLQMAPYSPEQADGQLQITIWLADEYGNGLSCFVQYMELEMVPVDVI